MKYSLFIVTILVLSAPGFSQEASVSAEALFFGFAKPVPIQLPLPSYPEGARKARLEGTVSIAIVVDENGKVIPTKPAAGPYPVCQGVTDPNVTAIRYAAMQAAGKAQFNPAAIEQQPTKADGWIKYLFAIEKKTDSKVTDGAVVLGSVADSKTGVRVASPNDPATLSTSAPGLSSPKTVPGGVLNGQALALPKPPYPAAARAVRASGQVAVRVLIDVDGSIYSAEAINGHPLLKMGSEVAACDSRFKPTLLSGEPVKVSGVITYNYVP